MFKKIAFFLFLVFLLSYCKPSTKTCSFIYEPKTTNLEWTAYKFTQMLGVKGSFKDVDVKGLKAGKTIEESVTDLTFSIKTSGVDTKLPERDAKLVKYFFAKLLKGETLEGKFQNVGLNKADLVLKINNEEKTIPLEYSIENETRVSLKTKINLLDWNAKEALDSLNAICKDLHTGTDGISKLWPDVEIKVVSTFQKKCE